MEQFVNRHWLHKKYFLFCCLSTECLWFLVCFWLLFVLIIPHYANLKSPFSNLAPKYTGLGFKTFSSTDCWIRGVCEHCSSVCGASCSRLCRRAYILFLYECMPVCMWTCGSMCVFRGQRTSRWGWRALCNSWWCMGAEECRLRYQLSVELEHIRPPILLSFLPSTLRIGSLVTSHHGNCHGLSSQWQWGLECECHQSQQL